jgi:hypothetical protein
MTLLDPTRILIADDGADVVKAQDASVVIHDPDTGEPGYLSLWQQNLVGFRATRLLNWKAAPGSVAWMSGIDYPVSGS